MTGTERLECPDPTCEWGIDDPDSVASLVEAGRHADEHGQEVTVDRSGDGFTLQYEPEIVTDGGTDSTGTDHERRRQMWDPDRVIEAEKLVDRRLTTEERTALEYHEPLPESLPEEVRERV